MKNNELIMIYGNEYKEMTKRVLEAADLASEIGDRNAKIGLKPNLVVAREASSGATTHPEIVAGVIEYLQDKGFQNIDVIEGSWVGDDTASAYNASGIGAAAKKYGVKCYNLKRDSYTEVTAGGYPLRICDRALDCDMLINLPVLKGHCQTTVTCALKNHKGIIPDAEKRRFHSQGLHKPIAHLGLAVKENIREFIVVDNICGDLDFEEGGNPVQMDRIFVAKDPVLCDAFVCETMGYSVDDVPYIRMAERLGVGDADISHAKITEIDADNKIRMPKKTTRRVDNLAKYVAADDACSACYGQLIYALDRLNEEGGIRVKEKICIGQGYRGKEGDGIGIGTCTRGLRRSCPGCPPTAKQMKDFLRNL